jgi:cellulose synthase/poly-beta-1,6-N-acetylglucosamine synthase-like glycosyltransferase
MDVPSALLVVQGVVLVYLAGQDLLTGLVAYGGVRAAIAHSRELPEVAHKDVLEGAFYQPVSILVPAYNQEGGIVAGVRSLLSLPYPQFEVVVSNDGSTDATLERLIDAFALVEVPRIYRRRLETEVVQRVYRSLRHPNLLVLDKAHGGRPDALNAGINVAQFPLICPVDSGTVVDGDVLLRASRRFLADPALVAIGGPVRPLNGAVVRDGRVADLQLPSTWLERFQVVDHARAALVGSSGWSRFDAGGVFRRESVIEIGGYPAGAEAGSLDLVLRFRRQEGRHHGRYRVEAQGDPLYWSAAPTDLTTLRHVWRRRQAALWSALWRHRGMLFNPRYGRAGLLGIPALWLFEALSPVVEIAGYAAIPVALVLGALHGPFVGLFLALAVLFGILVSQLAVGAETLLRGRYPRPGDRMALVAATVLQFAGYRQAMAAERLLAGIRTGAVMDHPPTSSSEPFHADIHTVAPDIRPAAVSQPHRKPEG